jgi:heterodisulfide reductase subunit A-like polyferredoxin
MAMRTTLTRKTPVMFRSEYVAGVDPERCNGCGACRKLCPFGAFAPAGRKEKARIDPQKCFGCGICRSVCARDAIGLADRAAVPEAALLWL